MERELLFREINSLRQEMETVPACKSEVIYINPEYHPINFWKYPHPRGKKANCRLTVFDFFEKKKKIWENWNGVLPPQTNPDTSSVIGSVLDIYNHIKLIGDNCPATLSELHFFTHGYAGGPIIYNTYDSLNDPDQRDPADKDPRIKDFTILSVLGGAEQTRFKKAFSPEAIVKMWGCNYEQDHRDKIKKYLKLKNAAQKAVIKQEIQAYIRDNTYQFAFTTAIGIPVYAAPLGWGTNPYLPYDIHGSKVTKHKVKYGRKWPPAKGDTCWRVSEWFRPNKGDKFYKTDLKASLDIFDYVAYTDQIVL